MGWKRPDRIMMGGIRPDRVENEMTKDPAEVAAEAILLCECDRDGIQNKDDIADCICEAYAEREAELVVFRDGIASAKRDANEWYGKWAENETEKINQRAELTALRELLKHIREEAKATEDPGDFVLWVIEAAQAKGGES